MGNLDQDPCSVARLGIAPGSTAMRQVDQNLEAFADNVVAFLPADAGHEAHAAGIVLLARMVKPLRLGFVVTTVRSTHWIHSNLLDLQNRVGSVAQTLEYTTALAPRARNRQRNFSRGPSIWTALRLGFVEPSTINENLLNRSSDTEAIWNQCA